MEDDDRLLLIQKKDKLAAVTRKQEAAKFKTPSKFFAEPHQKINKLHQQTAIARSLYENALHFAAIKGRFPPQH